MFQMGRISISGRVARALGAASLAAVLAAGIAGVAVPPAGAATSGPATAAAAAAATASVLSWPELRQGSNSTWPKATVRSLQYLLNANGAKLAVDGVFGEALVSEALSG
jgi:peptidoglycan DL-endopeptidase CwlO